MPKRKIRTCGCFMEFNNKFLVLLRHPGRFDGGTWGLPAGKVERGETDEQTILREIREETGYNAHKNELIFLGQFDFEFDDMFLEFPTYRLMLKQPVDIVIDPVEHVEYKWVSAKECCDLPNSIRSFKDLLIKTKYIKGRS